MIREPGRVLLCSFTSSNLESKIILDNIFFISSAILIAMACNAASQTKESQEGVRYGEIK